MAKKSKTYFIYLFLFVILAFTLFIYFYTLWLSEEKTFHVLEDITHKDCLAKYGVCIFKKALSLDKADELKKECDAKHYSSVKASLLSDGNLLQIIRDAAGSQQYVFQDYIWIIQKSSVHTCHRDNNGDFFNDGQKYQSYTMLVYLEDMERCLSVIPKSHGHLNSHFIDFGGSLRTVLCNKGDVILFNANLIHAGCINEKDDHVRIQLKVTHKDDIPIISYYQDYNKVLNEGNSVPKNIRRFQQNVSCMFPGISNYTQQENIKTARGSDNGAKIGYGQKIFSYLFYGNADYYDLPNV